MLLSGNARGFPGQREPGSSIVGELLEGDDPILTLGAHRRTGATIETVVTVDPAHTVKNTSLQPMGSAASPHAGRTEANTISDPSPPRGDADRPFARKGAKVVPTSEEIPHVVRMRHDCR